MYTVRVESRGIEDGRALASQSESRRALMPTERPHSQAVGKLFPNYQN